MEFKTDFKTINKIGTKIGIEAFKALGESLISCSASSASSTLGVIIVFEAYFLANMIPTTKATILVGNPNAMTKPKSAPKIPAAAIGPGVGGTIVCDAIKPKPNAIAGPAMEILAFLERLLFRGCSNIKPLSANTGIDTI